MELLFLGTSSGVPTRERNVSALALIAEKGKHWWLLDCGEATQHQLLRTNLSIHDLQAVFITHLHGDHCYGMPGLLASAAMHGRKQALQVIAPRVVISWLQATQQLTELYLPYPVIWHEVETLSDWQDEVWQVSAHSLNHRVPSYAYRFIERQPAQTLATDKLLEAGIPRGPLWGQLQQGQTICYNGQQWQAGQFLLSQAKRRQLLLCGDNGQPEILQEIAAETDVLVHEATYSDEVAQRLGADFGHSSALQLARFAQQMSLPNLIMTHFSARYGSDSQRSPSVLELAAEARSVYSGNLFLARDFARFKLDRQGSLTQLTQD